jgi:hypothetical protein
MRDQETERKLMRLRRAEEDARRAVVDRELAAMGAIDGATLTEAAFDRLEELLGGVRHLSPDEYGWRRHAEGSLICAVRPADRPTVIHAPQGRLTLLDLEVVVERRPTALTEADAAT